MKPWNLIKNNLASYMGECNFEGTPPSQYYRANEIQLPWTIFCPERLSSEVKCLYHASLVPGSWAWVQDMMIRYVSHVEGKHLSFRIHRVHIAYPLLNFNETVLKVEDGRQNLFWPQSKWGVFSDTLWRLMNLSWWSEQIQFNNRSSWAPEI